MKKNKSNFLKATNCIVFILFSQLSFGQQVDMTNLQGKWKISRVEFEMGLFIDIENQDSSRANFLAMCRKKSTSKEWTTNDSARTEMMYQQMFSAIKTGFVVFNTDSTFSSNLYGLNNGQPINGTYCYDNQCQQLYLKKDSLCLNYHIAKISLLTRHRLVFINGDEPRDIVRMDYKKEE